MPLPSSAGHRPPRRAHKEKIMARFSLLLAAAMGCALTAACLNGADAAPGVPSPASQPASQASAERIKSLIDRMGDADSTVRDAAQRELIQIGQGAMDALVQATKNPDAEVRSRATEIVREIRASATLALSKGLAKNHLWSFEIPAGTIGSPVVFGERLYVVGGDWKLYSIDTKAGKKVWDADHQGKGSFALAAGEKVAAIIQGAGLTVHDVKDGKELWKKDVPGAAGPTGGPAIGGAPGKFPTFVPSQVWIVGDTVVVKATDGLKAFKTATGDDAWDVEVKLEARPSNAAEAAGVVCMSSGKAVMGVDLASHKQIWSKDIANCAVLGSNGKLFCALAESKLYMLDPMKGDKLWEADLPADPKAKPTRAPSMGRRPAGLVMDDSRLYIVFGSQEFTTYDLKTGASSTVSFDSSLLEAAARQASAGSDDRTGAFAPGVLSLGGSRIASGGKYYTNTNNNALLAFDGKTGQNLWMLPTKQTVVGNLIIADGVLYYVTLKGVTKTAESAPAPQPQDLSGVHALKLP
jgi:outer membrane protein assembly factor BamB